MDTQFSDEELRKKLTPEEYKVLREKGTEAPFSGEYYNSKEIGMFHCKACGNELFSSDDKFDSGCGWPSFSEVAKSKNVELSDDFSHGMQRVEVKCAKCNSHLGHLFPDGPTPTGKRYCINSVCLKLKKKD